METDLRLILLGVGLLVVGGIVLDGMRRRRKGQVKEKLEEFDQTVFEKQGEHAHDPLLEGYFSKTQTKGSEFDKDINAENVILTGTPHYVPMNYAPEEVIALTIVPRQSRGFSGRAFLSALQSTQMNYGDKRIFHRYEEQEGTQSIAFSLASMTEPGTIEVDQLNYTVLPGIMMFMVLPGPADPLMTFEQMLSVARQLASGLVGELCDYKRSHLTIQTIEHYREQIREFMRRRLAQQR